MSQSKDDIEAAPLAFDKEDQESESYNSWSRQQFSSSSRQLWRRLQSVSLPGALPSALPDSLTSRLPSGIPIGLPIRKLSQLGSRYMLISGIVVLLILTSLTLHTSGYTVYSSDYTSSSPSDPASSSSPDSSSPSSDEILPSNQTAGSHIPVPNSDFCTVWPVDEAGAYNVSGHERTNRVKLSSIAPPGGWRKPEGVKVIAMVFYGRKRYVDILDCYLQQNLASNGGYLDEVWFMVHTDVEDDIAWVKSLVAGTPDYKVVGQDTCNKNDGKYGCLWEYPVADNTIYIKLDDDIIYIHQDAIPQLVHTRLAVPHAFAVSAQLVNSPITGMEQFHHNAIYPFVPDAGTKPSHRAAEEWRLSNLPRYPADKLKALKTADDKKLMFPEAPYRGHPFVLISEDNYDLLHTAMGRYDQNPGGDFIAFSPMWRSWAMAAQQQYSLLYNLEKNQLSRYFFGRPARYPADAKGPNPNATVAVHLREGEPVLGGEQVYDTQFRRYNLNFCAVWGSDIKEHLPMKDDDEDAITREIPRDTGRPFIIDTRAIVGHFSFFTQINGTRQTDLLDRYRAFANEAVCAPDNLKTPWDFRCPNFEA